MRRTISLTILALAAASTPAVAVAQGVEPERPTRQAVSLDVFASADADDSAVFKAGVGYDWLYEGAERRRGLRLETARFSPRGQTTLEEQRIYLRAADRVGDWKWTASFGTDGDTLLGTASIHDDARYRQEWFVERERVETPLGTTLGIYQTFAGGAVDVPVGDRTTLTLLAGLQDFTGENVRTHLRANLVHVISEEQGLSVQVRTRWFENSDPNEFDYFSPEWYGEVMPIVQIRRRLGDWRYSAAAGYGAQRSAGTDWSPARHVSASVVSPPIGRDWALRADVLYSDTPVTNGGAGYDYLQGGLTLTRAF